MQKPFMWRDPAWLLDMLTAGRRVREYAKDLTEEAFLASSRDQYAILRQLTILARQPANLCGTQLKAR